MSLIRKHVAVLQAWACLDLVLNTKTQSFWQNKCISQKKQKKTDFSQRKKESKA